MSFTPNTGDYKSSRSDVFMLDPRALVVDWRKNLSRNGEEPPEDESLIALARDMAPHRGDNATAEGTSGQIHPVTTRPLPDRRLEVIGGFRRVKAALWLISSGECPDFQIKCIVSRLSDAEAALTNASENIQREDPKPIQLAHLVRSLTENYGLEIPAIAGRLKRSAAYLERLLGLVMLPAPIQASIADGTTTVSAGLELARLPTHSVSAVFDAAKAANGEVKVAAVKKVARKKAEATAARVGGKPKAVKRSLKDVEDYLESKCGEKPTRGKKFADTLLLYIDGKATEPQMDNAWDLAFGR